MLKFQSFFAVPQKSLETSGCHSERSEESRSTGTETLRSAQGDKVSFALLPFFAKLQQIKRSPHLFCIQTSAGTAALACSNANIQEL
jgi:hypothetical protein